MRSCKDIVIKLFAVGLFWASASAVSAQGWMDVPEEPESETASAENEGEYEETPEGFIWVNPVEYFKLQKANGTGNDNFNNVLKKQKKKIFGIKAHPIAGAVEPDSQIDDKYTYGNISGFIGVAVSGGTLTIDTSSAASGEYNIKYTYTQPIIDPDNGKKVATWDYDCSMNLAFSGIRMTSSDSGVGFSYTAKISGTIKGHGYGDRVKYNPDFPPSSASVSGNSSLAHFIYRGGESSLFLILSMPNISKGAGAHGPGPRVYFVVDKVLVAQEAPPPMTAEDKEILTDYTNDLMDWLTGYNDRLGLGEHTPEKESLVIQTIAAILSLLLGAGGVGLVGGTAGAVTGGFTEMIINGGQPTTPPDIPPVERDPMRRPEDDEGEPQPPFPPDQNPYRDVENKYVTRNPDGSVTVKDPVTGESRLYLPDGHGGYDNPLTGGGFKSDADMLDHLALLDRNRDPLSQDAATAERNRREQHEAWEAQNKRDLERGYSDEMKEYRDWKAEQERRLEREIQKEHQISKLAAQYHVEATEEAVRKALKIDQIQAGIESAKQQAEAADNNVWVVGLESTKNVAATSLVLIPLALSGAGTVSVATAAKAKIVQSCFTMSTSVIDKVGDAYVKGKSMVKAAAHGAIIGAVGVAQNYAGEIGGLAAGKLAPNAIDAVRKTVNLGTEAAVVIGGEGFKAGYNEFTESGDPKKILDKTLGGLKDGTKNHLINKTVEVGFNKAKSWASSGKPTVESTRAHADSTAKTLTSSKQAAASAQKQVSHAQSRVSETRQNVARTQQQVTAAQGKVNNANKQLTAANNKVEAAKQKLKQKLNHAKTPAEVNKARSELRKAEHSAAKAQQNVNRANSELRTAERIDNASKREAIRAEHDLQKAQMGAQKAQSDLKTATAQHDQALRDAHAAEQKAQIDKNVYHVSGNDVVGGGRAVEDHLKNRDKISKEK